MRGIPNNISQQEIADITRKNRKKSFFGGVDEVVSRKLFLVPLLKVNLRYHSSILNVTKTRKVQALLGLRRPGLFNKHFKFTPFVIDLSEEEIFILKTINKERKISTNQLAKALGVTKHSILPELTHMKERNIISYDKEGKEYFWYPVKRLSTQKILKFDIPNIMTKEMNVPEMKQTITGVDYKNFMKVWFNCDILSTEKIFLPVYEVAFKKKKIYINGFTKKLL